jgi:hypothetical protein
MAKRRKSIFNFSDFRGGYAVSVPNELMKDNELLQAENCRWSNGLSKREGLSKYASLTGSCRGFIRTYTNDAWHTIVAVDTGSAVELHQGTADTFATITRASGTSYTWTTDKDVYFAALGDEVVAVNGTDRPAAIFPTSSAIYAMDLDRYDERDRDNDNWYAGQYDGSATTYTDDTTDAQDVGSGDFLIASTTFTNGFYLASDFTFSKMVFAGVDPGTPGSASGTYQYYDGSSWASIGTFNEAFLNASATEWGSGTVTAEFELPMSTDGTLKWQRYDASEGDLTDRYVVRCVFSGLTDDITCDSMEVSHTHYLTQILGDAKPQAITTHKNHVFMAADNQVQIGIANSIKGWRADRWEYFFEGGKEVVGLITLNEYLAVVKTGAIFAIDGTSWQNWSTRTLTKNGAIAPRGMVVAKGVLWHIDRDGLYAFDGVRRVKVSSHIQSDIDGYTLSDAACAEYNGWVYVSFPTDEEVLVFDPDTYRTDQVGIIGEGRVSLYKYTDYLARGMEWHRASDDNGKFLVLGTNYLGEAEDGNTADNLTSTVAINMQAQTKYYGFGQDQTAKLYNRVKPKVGDVSTASAQSYTFKILHSDETGGASESVTLTAGTGTGYHQEDVLVPAEIDGKLIGFYVQHNSEWAAKLYSVSVDTRERRY